MLIMVSCLRYSSSCHFNDLNFTNNLNYLILTNESLTSLKKDFSYPQYFGAMERYEIQCFPQMVDRCGLSSPSSIPRNIHVGTNQFWSLTVLPFLPDHAMFCHSCNPYRVVLMESSIIRNSTLPPSSLTWLPLQRKHFWNQTSSNMEL